MWRARGPERVLVPEWAPASVQASAQEWVRESVLASVPESGPE